jgi:rubrerythrin
MGSARTAPVPAAAGPARSRCCGARGDPQRLRDRIGGRDFCRRGSFARDAALADLFTCFAAMEGEHGHAVTALSRRRAGGRLQLQPGARRSTPVHGAPDRPEQLFRVAIALEQRAAAFFTDKANDSAQGSPERELYRELAAEEREHAELLELELERWLQGRAGQMLTPDASAVRPC